MRRPKAVELVVGRRLSETALELLREGQARLRSEVFSFWMRKIREK